MHYSRQHLQTIRRLMRALTFSLLLPLLPLGANLRAPLHLHHPPSGHLLPPAATLIVTSESLEFRCRQSGRLIDECTVAAEYQTTAADAGEFLFRFILVAKPTRIQAIINGKNLPVEIVPERAATASDPRSGKPRSAHNPRRHGYRPERFTARFRGQVATGPNSIRIEYRQPISYYETDYSGCYPCWSPKAGRFARYIGYELWPLKEWTRAAGFTLQIHFRLRLPERNLTERLFKKKRAVSCRSADRHSSVERSLLKPTEYIRDKNGLSYRLQFREAFPDVITFYYGDEDIIPDR